jgi:hypothetical protein
MWRLLVPLACLFHGIVIIIVGTVVIVVIVGTVIIVGVIDLRVKKNKSYYIIIENNMSVTLVTNLGKIKIE